MFVSPVRVFRQVETCLNTAYVYSSKTKGWSEWNVISKKLRTLDILILKP